MHLVDLKVKNNSISQSCLATCDYSLGATMPTQSFKSADALKLLTTLHCIVTAESAVLVSAVHCVRDASVLFEGDRVLFWQPCPRHLITDGYPVVVQVVLAPENLQIPPCAQ